MICLIYLFVVVCTPLSTEKTQKSRLFWQFLYANRKKNISFSVLLFQRLVEVVRPFPHQRPEA